MLHTFRIYSNKNYLYGVTRFLDSKEDALNFRIITYLIST
jgi:hypothetical protein